MTVTRIVRPGRIVGIALLMGGLLAGGCGKPGANPKPKAEAETPNTIVSPGGTQVAAAAPPVPPGQDPTPAATTFAREFLVAARDGKAAPAQLTESFKRVVAPPVLSADAERGYSDLVAEEWLQKLAGRVGPDGLAVAALTPDAAVASAPPPAGTAALPIGRSVLRVVKAADGWAVDWLHLAPPGSGNPQPLTGQGDELAARFAAAAVLETALAGAFAQTEVILSPALKARVAPPLGGDDMVRGYNRTILRQKLGGFRGNSSGYTVAKWDVAGVSGTAAGDLLDPAGAKRPFALKLVRGPKPAEWLVDDFDPR